MAERIVTVVFLAGALLLPPVGCHREKSGQPTRNPSSSLVLTIRTDKSELAVGEYPRICGSITNNGTTVVRLVHPGDGSSVGWRPPHTRFEIALVEPQTGRTVRESPRGEVLRCGNVNRITLSDVFELQSGESIELRSWFNEYTAFTEPGTYKVALHYTNDPHAELLGVPLGQHDPAAMAAIRQTLPCDLTSNALVFTVR